jgi:hypothetical protein
MAFLHSEVQIQRVDADCLPLQGHGQRKHRFHLVLGLSGRS